MPKRRRRQAGRYKKQSGAQYPEASFPLLLFQAENGLWGVKDAEGNIESEALYHRASQSAEEKAGQLQRLIHHHDTEVLLLIPKSCDLLCYFCLD